MASASTADTWRDSGIRGERPLAGPQALRTDLPRLDATPARASRGSLPPVPPPAPRGRPGGNPDRRSPGAGRPGADPRPPAGRAPQRTPAPGGSPHAGRPHPSAPLADRDVPPRRSRAEDRPSRESGRDTGRDAGRSPRGATRSAPAAPDRAPGLRGALAVLGVFVITLAGGAVDSFLAVGLGTLTLVTLVAASAVATLLVRRRDLLTVAACPPLVFVLVAAVNVGLAPSASFNLPTIATVLIRGFPTMAVATAVVLVLAVVRWASRR
jgi:hypothetical protein